MTKYNEILNGRVSDTESCSSVNSANMIAFEHPYVLHLSREIRHRSSLLREKLKELRESDAPVPFTLAQALTHAEILAHNSDHFIISAEALQQDANRSEERRQELAKKLETEKIQFQGNEGRFRERIREAEEKRDLLDELLKSEAKDHARTRHELHECKRALNRARRNPPGARRRRRTAKATK